MLELGAAEEEGHRQVGRRVAALDTRLITVGRRARWIADEARAHGLPAERITVCAEHAEAAATARPLLTPESYVLVKGSRGMELERVVAALRRTQERE